MPDYVRISEDMMSDKGLEIVIQMMETKWDMTPPSMLISVTGGAGNLRRAIGQTLQDQFKKGLVAAAKSANAWIVTGGTNCGVMEIVGDAVHESFGQVTTIGCASWGIVKGRSQLINKKEKLFSGQQKQPMADNKIHKYNTKSLTEANERGAYLDPFHTNFLLVDNGTQGKYGVEVEFRSRLENKLSHYYEEEFGKKVPVIVILMEGGPNSVQTCLTSVRKNIPVLVLEGTGRAADIIAAAYDLSEKYENPQQDGTKKYIRLISDKNKEVLKDKVADIFPSNDVEKILTESIELVKNHHLLTIYKLEGKDFDYALLYALLRSDSSPNAQVNQMGMAIEWDRADLAREHILATYVNDFEEEQLNMFMMQAVLKQKCEFVQLIIDQGADMKSFLSHGRLAELYRSPGEGKRRFFADIKIRFGKKKKEILLQDVGNLLERILEGTYNNNFQWKSQEYYDNKVKNSTFDDPYDLMVIYAALNNAQALSFFFWEWCQSPLTTALVAYRIYIYHAEHSANLLQFDEEYQTGVEEAAAKFESMACSCMSHCGKLFDKEEAHLLLTTVHKRWGINTFFLAQSVNAKNFLAHSTVQNYLSDVWSGNIHRSEPTWKIGLLSAFPLPVFLKYDKIQLTEIERTEEMNARLLLLRVKNRKLRRKKTMLDRVGSLGRDLGQNLPNITEEVDVEDHEMDLIEGIIKTKKSKERKDRKLTIWERYMTFYRTPLIKFIFYIVNYIIFIGFFGYTLVASPTGICSLYKETSISLIDVYLLLYVISTLPTEILQIVTATPKTWHGKLWVYTSDFFNILDVLAICSYFSSFIIKAALETEKIEVGHECYHAQHFIHTKADQDFGAANVQYILHIVSFMCYVIRFLQVFKVSSNMGPKLIMINKMLMDLVFFIFLLLLFMFCYSIGAQAILVPNKNAEIAGEGKDYWNFMFDLLFYRPYLSVFGEFNLEGWEEDFISGHCAANETDCDKGSILRNNTIGRTHWYIFVFFTFVFLMFVNVLLINLLIAIFNYSYGVVQEQADILYKVQRSHLITEFKDRVWAPNPFCLPIHFYIFGRWIVRMCYPLNTIHQDSDHVSEFYRMCQVDRECKDEYILHREEDDQDFAKNTLISIKKNLNMLKLDIKENSGAMGPLGFDIREMQEQDAYVAKISNIRPFEIHMDARQSPYPGADPQVERTPVEDTEVSWKVPLPKYDPVEYTDTSILDGKPRFVDSQDIRKITYQHFNDTQVLHEEGPDKAIDRVSKMGKYDLELGTHRPINPRGRTGMRGRGLLSRWGPNHSVDPVISRWARDGEGEVIKIDGKNVLEFVAVLRKDTKEWAIPGGRIKPGEKLVGALQREFTEEALGTLGLDKEEQDRIARMATAEFGQGITIFRGYVDDPRNTDNAWMETVAVNYHDNTGDSFAKFPLAIGRVESNKSSATKWIAVDENKDFFANHEWIIEKTLFHRDAYNPISRESISGGTNELASKKTSVWGMI